MGSTEAGDLRRKVRQWAGIVNLIIVLASVTGVIGAADVAAEEPGPMTSSRITTDHLQQYSDLALTCMQEYLRIDTTNPPGHEMRAVSFYKKILDQEGIENRVFEYTPGHGDATVPPSSSVLASGGTVGSTLLVRF